jgi:hypothetical protein
VQGKVESAQLARQRLDESLSQLDQTIKAATSEAERKQGETQLEIAREARNLPKRIAAAGQAWIGGLDEALRMWKTTLAVAENPRPSTYVDARKAAEQLPLMEIPGASKFDATFKAPKPGSRNSTRSRRGKIRQQANLRSCDWILSASVDQIRKISTFLRAC